ncbi:hypothetical protein QTG56_24790 (plasmid) [Rossellomorea sp. AcN35-11]|nr:hypothetical protein [Rossellomorea aquimaris]WJV31853.1 hypothetical protein QTG56_24790 [Rossellomorea sp. AcN35-11]
MVRDYCRACGKIHWNNYITGTEYGDLAMCNKECSDYYKGDLEGKIGTETIEGHEVILYFNQELFKEPMEVAVHRKEDHLIGPKYVEFATLRTRNLHIACTFGYDGYKEVTSTHFKFRILELNEQGAWRRTRKAIPVEHIKANPPETKEESLEKLRRVFEQYLAYYKMSEGGPGGSHTDNQLQQLALF